MGQQDTESKWRSLWDEYTCDWMPVKITIATVMNFGRWVFFRQEAKIAMLENRVKKLERLIMLEGER